MFRLSCSRFFSSSKVFMSATKSSALGKLRKSTGYPLSNCKKALELFPGDVVKAEEWLHAEAKQKGWAKWAKMQERTAAQGLIGVFAQDSTAVMLEVNCETDFVARNAEFQEFVGKILNECSNHAKQLTCDEDVSKVILEETSLSTLKSNSTTVGELVLSAVTKFNEKTVAKRAVCFKVKKDLHLTTLSHPSIMCPNLNGATLGKYGALLAFKKKTDTNTDISDKEIGANICQHIIGMKPLSLGKITDKDLANILASKTSEPEDRLAPAEAIQSESDKESADSTEVEDQNLEDSLKETNETRLLFQPFLLDSDVTVGEVLNDAGIEVLDFERFECGESNLEIEDVTELEKTTDALRA